MPNLLSARATRYDRLRALLSAARAEPRPLRPTLAGEALLLALLGERTELAYARVGRDWTEVGVDLVEDLLRALERLREALALAAPLLPSARYARADRRVARLLRRVRRRSDLDRALREVRARDERSEGRIDAEALLRVLKRRQKRAAAKLQRRAPPLQLLRQARQLLELAAAPADPTRSLAELARPHLERRLAGVERTLARIEHPKDVRGQRRLAGAFHQLVLAVAILAEAYPETLGADALGRALQPIDAALLELVASRRLLRLVKKHGRRGTRGLEHLRRSLAQDAKARARAARTTLLEHAPPLLAALRTALEAVPSPAPAAPDA